LTDPGAQWTAAAAGPAFYAYSTNTLIDVDARVIVDVEATPAHRTAEVNATKTMIERTTAQNLRRLAKWCGHGPPIMATEYAT